MVQDHTYLRWSTYSSPSWYADRFGQFPLLPRKRAPDITHSTPADRFMGPYPVSLLSQLMKQGHKPSSCGGPLLGLPGPYHRHVIGTFNTCSRGPTHRSLTDTGGGYNLRCAGLPHTTLRPSQLVVSTFHLRASPGLQFNQVSSTKSKCRV
jgi:hypothetical protein